MEAGSAIDGFAVYVPHDELKLGLIKQLATSDEKVDRCINYLIAKATLEHFSRKRRSPLVGSAERELPCE